MISRCPSPLSRQGLGLGLGLGLRLGLGLGLGLGRQGFALGGLVGFGCLIPDRVPACAFILLSASRMTLGTVDTPCAMWWS